jgi:trimethylamine--corrinoid protein Co-methyltransferase
MVVSGVGGPPNVSDLEGGRRIGNYEDMCNFTRLVQSLNIVHQDGGGAVEPQDLPAATRHLDMYRAMITLTDKTWHGYALGADRAEDAIEATCIARQCDRETLAEKPGAITIINTNSPLRLDIPMSEGMTAYVRCGQPVVITPFTLAGAMSPATIAGALAQQNAEALGVIAIAQCIRPGTPVIYGGFTSNVDMKSGAPAFGTPEYAKAVLAGCQLARRYRIPYRSSNVNASNAVDAQAAYESEMSLWAAVTGQAHLLYQGVGWLEGGLVASFEKLILDAEMIQHMAELLVPFEVNDDTLGIEAMRDVGPGGHFFGTQHTLDRYETAFYDPILSDWRNYESWREAGSPDAATRAHRIWKQLLADYEEPPIDPGVVDELDAFIAKRKEAGGAKD